jgi:hypothetical protein
MSAIDDLIDKLKIAIPIDLVDCVSLAEKDLAFLRSRIIELENEVENRTFGKWGVMKRLVEENGQLKNRIAELDKEADEEHAKLVKLADEFFQYRAEREWQPIETAPAGLEHKEILEFIPGFGVFIVHQYELCHSKATHWKSIEPPKEQK